jgi:hypothetical protein
MGAGKPPVCKENIMNIFQPISTTTGAALVALVCAGGMGCAGPQAPPRTEPAAEAAINVKPTVQPSDAFFPPRKVQVTVPLDPLPSASPAASASAPAPPNVTAPR